MSDHSQPQVVRSYLRELDSALVDVPVAARRAILDGASEELSGLDAEAATAHIEKLGDPEFIAAEARAESTKSPAVSAAAIGGARRWYVVVASLLVAFGGIVVPGIGWIAGIVMVWMSAAWRTWEKWVATLLSPALTLLAVLIPYWFFATPRAATTVEGQVSNPLIPALFDVVWSGILFVMGVNVVVGLWLLVRALRRSDAPG